LGNRWLGVLAIVMLLLMPRFYGHAFINSKDIPFAIGMIGLIGGLTSMFARGRYHWHEIVACGLLIGCTVAVRPGGWLLIGPMYVALVVAADWCRRRRSPDKPRRRTFVKQAAMFAIAWGVMVLLWPWAHESPISHPLQSIRLASKFHLVVPVLFDGDVLSSDALPRYYLIKHLLITTPPGVLLLAACGIAVASYRQLRYPLAPRAIVVFGLQVWLGLPLLLFGVLRPNAYDGIRHFLFLLPAIAVFAAVGVVWLWSTIQGRYARTAFALALVGMFTWQAVTLVQLHPYQMTYFNGLVGGVKGADGRYDTDYWLTSYKEAMQWIRQQPSSSQTGEPIRVLVAANELSLWCAEYYADERFELETMLDAGIPGDLPAGFDYYIGTSRFAMSENFPDARVVKQVVRRGAVLANVKQSASETKSLSQNHRGPAPIAARPFGDAAKDGEEAWARINVSRDSPF
jgi:hypothetical protein